jgi:BASS family bile acid:Na+ symporter
MVPAWVGVLARFTPLQLAIAPRAVAAILIPTVLVPFALGRLVHELWPRIARPLAKAAKVVFFAGIAILFATILVESFPVLRRLTPRGLLAVASVTLGSAALGYLAGGPRRDQRIAVAYGAALGNPALALAVIATTARGHALPLVGALVLLRAAVILPLGLWLGRRGRRRGEAARVEPDRAARWNAT